MEKGRTDISLTKLEVARRQLVTSIRLFFEDADSVSVYTLAHAAWEVLERLCKHDNKIYFFDQMVQANQIPKKELRKVATYGRNFFKHADWDPEAVLDGFSDELNDHVLISATYDYGTLADSKPVEIQLFQLWYFAAYPEKAPVPAFDEILKGANEIFPGFSELERAAQKESGRMNLIKAYSDRGLMSDPSTDTSSVGSIRN